MQTLSRLAAFQSQLKAALKAPGDSSAAAAGDGGAGGDGDSDGDREAAPVTKKVKANPLKDGYSGQVLPGEDEADDEVRALRDEQQESWCTRSHAPELPSLTFGVCRVENVLVPLCYCACRTG